MSKDKLSIPSDINYIDSVSIFLRSFDTIDALSEKQSHKIQLAVHEAVANSILHGNQQDYSKRVRVTVEEGNNELKITVNDRGNGFNYTFTPDPTTPENIEKEEGRGLFLMKTLSDKLIFEESGTTITLVFNIAIH